MSESQRSAAKDVGRKRLPLFLAAFLSSVALFSAIATNASALPALGLTSAANTFNSEPDWEAIQHSGATTFRMQFSWGTVAASGWEGTYDQYVEKAAKHGITILPYLYGAPGGRQQFFLKTEPEWSGWLNTFVWQAVSRYAENGTFWLAHPGIPQHPITAWEVWNEPNLGENNPKGIVQPRAYGEFLEETSNYIHGAANTRQSVNNARVLFGGLYQNAGVMNVSQYLQEATAKSNLGNYYDGLSIHPYSFTGSEEGRLLGMEGAVNAARSALNAYGGIGKSLWVTEMGWPLSGSDQPSVSESEQASLLTKGFNWLKAESGRLNLHLATWYFYRDTNGTRWDAHCGLREEGGRYRQSWSAYLAQTGAAPWPLPTVQTTEATGIRENQATLNGTVNPNGVQTSYHFEYGQSTVYGSSIPVPDGSAGFGGSGISESATISGLHSGTTYHYRLVASNANGTSYGDDKQLVTTSAPSAVNTGSAVNVYASGTNSRLYQKACCFGAEGWTSWWDMGSPPGGGITSGSAAVNAGGGVTNVYAGGANGHLYQKACCFGTEGWTSWWDMGSPPGGGITSAPSAVNTGSAVNVYAGGANGHLYQKACCFGTEGWTSWWDMGSPPGGGITSGSAAVNAGGGVTNVYAGGANGHLYQKACCFGTEGWTSWWDMGSPPGGAITSGPAAINIGSAVNVYAGGANGDLYQKSCCSTGGWTSWWDMGSPPGGGIISGPAAVDAGGGVTNVYVRGSNTHLYQKACCFGTEGWTSWWDMGSP